MHDLVDSEAVWWAQNRDVDGDGTVALPDVAAEASTTPVLVRYGTGRAIGRNGRDLAHLLDQPFAAWPVPVAELLIVGRSIGGLVARAACTTAAERDHSWLAPLTDVVYLGSRPTWDRGWIRSVTSAPGCCVARRTQPRSAG